ncbi:MAG TPA: mercury(II) reductase [Rhodospirillales bacterium]|jgi:mercuric reductase|nr:MAG: Mercuric reductase [Alphaproteobacteria bacterium MarineAlpha3_Bin2]HIM25373.1 mercury(II) reductase [Rhodospirillales bacterium]HIM78047.1 mercury(II) reductase [Rhodospirillales bacterium]
MSEKSESCCPPPSGKGGNGKYDLAVIGAGSAGFSAAITAAELGANVALIGHGTIGGTCVNVGCIPSKNLIRATESLHQAKAANRFLGIRGDAEITDWRAVMAQKDEIVTDLRQGKYIDVLPSYNNIAYIEGPVGLGVDVIAVNGEKMEAGKIVITTGASPAVPSIPGIEDVSFLTSTTALELEKLPDTLLVIGGGYIGVELAQMFARAGVRVTIVCRSRLLPHAEPEISDALADFLSDEGVTILRGVSYQSIKRTKNGVALSLAVDGKDEVVEAEEVLASVGRSPNTYGLGLGNRGVELRPDGGIQVDEYLRTTNPDIYAAGDVTGRDLYVYMAAYGAKLAARNALNGNTDKYDATVMPAVTFTDPQVASVGLTEREARDQGVDAKTSILGLEHVPRALAARDTRGLIKLVTDGATDRLVGAHMIAPEAGDSIQTAAIAIKSEMTATDLGNMIFPYLTTVEGLKLAAQTFNKDVSKLSCCAG